MCQALCWYKGAHQTGARCSGGAGANWGSVWKLETHSEQHVRVIGSASSLYALCPERPDAFKLCAVEGRVVCDLLRVSGRRSHREIPQHLHFSSGEKGC